jgi:predicted HicB family RNase H-like nuclease
MEQIRYLDSKEFKKFITTEAVKQNKSVNKFIQDNLRKVLKKPLDFKK